MNNKKPRLEPNKSFDLCRLACSLFDYFFESINDVEQSKDPVGKLIALWCLDDKNKNSYCNKPNYSYYPEPV